MKNIDKTRFDRLLSLCQEIGLLYEPGLVFIGGIGVFLHAVNHAEVKELAEATQDADLYISVAGYSDLREIEELTANNRLSKHEFKKGGFSFDVYTERQSKLPVPYSHVSARAQSYDGVRVAAPEHLLILKLDAAVERKGSEHGRKDIKDIIRLFLVSASRKAFDTKACCSFMQDRHYAMLEEISKGPEFLSLALGNAKHAKQMRTRFDLLLNLIRKEYLGDGEPAWRPGRSKAG